MADHLLTIGMLAACILCYVSQGLCGKLYSAFYDGRESDANPAYSTLYGLIVGVSVFVAALGLRLQASPVTWALGAVNGAVLFIYNMGVIRASRLGPFGFQSIFRTFGAVVVPMVFSLAFWGERLTGWQMGGIALMLASFVLINADGLVLKGVKKGYVGWVALLFVVNGTYALLMAAQQRLAGQAERNQMIVITFLSSALLSLVMLGVTRRGGALRAFRMCRRAWLSALGAGISAALAVVLLMILIGRMESLSVLYTVENGMVLVLTVVVSALLFHEKLSRTAIAGIALAVVSLVLLSI